MDTRPVAQRWRGSSVRELPSRPLPRGQVDVAGLPGFVANDNDAPRRRWRRSPTLLALGLALVALAWAALIFFPAHAAVFGAS